MLYPKAMLAVDKAVFCTPATKLYQHFAGPLPPMAGDKSPLAILFIIAGCKGVIANTYITGLYNCMMVCHEIIWVKILEFNIQCFL
jgi:hypothetical protein